MDPGFRYNLYYMPDASDICFLHPDSSSGTDVAPYADLLYFHRAFLSIPANQREFGAAQGELGEADEDLGGVRYHPGYLRLYPAYAVCAPARREGTGVFHPLIPFADSHGTTFWLPTNALHLESGENSRRMYLTDEFIYTIEMYASSCATHFGELLPWESTQTRVGRENPRGGRSSPEALPATSSLTTPEENRSAQSRERLMGETSAPPSSTGGRGNSLNEIDGPDEAPRSSTTGNSKGKEQALEDEAIKENQPGQALSTNLPDVIGEKQGVLEAKVDTVKSFAGASSGTGASAEGKIFQTFASVVSRSRKQVALRSSEATVEQVKLARVLYSTIEKSSPIDSIQQDLTASPPLAGKEGTNSETSPKLAHSFPGNEPEGHNEDVAQNLCKEESEAISDPKINVQEDQAAIPPYRSKELSIAYTDPYGIQQPEEEKVAVTPPQFMGDFLDDEMWPALPITQDLGTTFPSKRAGKYQEGTGTLPTRRDGQHQALGTSLPKTSDETGQASRNDLPQDSDPMQNQAVLDAPTIISEKGSQIGGGTDTSESIIGVSTIIPPLHSRISERNLVQKTGAQGNEDHSIDHTDPYRIQQLGDDIVAVTPAQVKRDFMDEKTGPLLPIAVDEASLPRDSASPQDQEAGSLRDQTIEIHLPTNSDGQDQTLRSTLPTKSDSLEQAMLSDSPAILVEERRDIMDLTDLVQLTVGASSGTSLSRSRTSEEELVQEMGVQRGIEQSIAYTDPYRIQQREKEKIATTPADFRGDFEDEMSWPTLPRARDQRSWTTLSNRRSRSQAVEIPHSGKKFGRGFGTTQPKNSMGHDSDSGTSLHTKSAWHEKTLVSTVSTKSGKEDQALGTGLPSVSDGINLASKNLLGESDQVQVVASITSIPRIVGEKGKVFEGEAADTLRSIIGTASTNDPPSSKAYEANPDRRIGGQSGLVDLMACTFDHCSIQRIEERNAANTPDELEGDSLYVELWPAVIITRDQDAKETLPTSTSGFPILGIDLSSDNQVQEMSTTLPSSRLGEDQRPRTPILTETDQEDQVLGTSLPSYSYEQPWASGKTYQLEKTQLTATPKILNEREREFEDRVAIVEPSIVYPTVGARLHALQSRTSKGMLLQNIEAQRRIEKSIASADPYRMQQAQEEIVANTPDELEGNFLDEEVWPALPTTKDMGVRKGL